MAVFVLSSRSQLLSTGCCYSTSTFRSSSALGRQPAGLSEVQCLGAGKVNVGMWGVYVWKGRSWKPRTCGDVRSLIMKGRTFYIIL